MGKGGKKGSKGCIVIVQIINNKKIRAMSTIPRDVVSVIFIWVGFSVTECQGPRQV